MDTLTTITAFKDQLTARGYAEATVIGYGKNLDRFAAWLERHQIRDLKRVTAKTIAAYQQHLAAAGTAPETKALMIRAVKRLFEYLEQTHRLLINPAEGIVEIRRRHRRIGPVLTMSEVETLLAQPDLSSTIGIRNRAVMEVLYATAMRLNELICLETGHVAFKDKTIRIATGKGGKQRVVPLGKRAATHLKAYLLKVRPLYAQSSEPRLFLLNRGCAVTPESIRGMLRKYRNQAGIHKSASPHTLRRSCATHLLQNGMDIRYIQKLLGHARLSTTQTYTKVMPKEVKQTHTRTHPGVAP